MLYSEKMPIFTSKHPAQTVTVDGAAYARDMFETIFKDFQQGKDVHITGLLADLMNRLTEDYSEKRKQHLVDIFTACSRYEAAFWDMAWEMRQ